MIFPIVIIILGLGHILSRIKPIGILSWLTLCNAGLVISESKEARVKYEFTLKLKICGYNPFSQKMIKTKINKQTDRDKQKSSLC